MSETETAGLGGWSIYGGSSQAGSAPITLEHHEQLRSLLASVNKIKPTAGTDYRAQAHQWAGPGREAMVDAIALFLHHNESLHMHEDVGEACCAYCWLRAGKAVLALTQAGILEGAR